jgi:hypothetical protein
MRNTLSSILGGIIGGFIAFMAFQAPSTIAKGVPETIKANEFQVVNNNGKVVASLGIQAGKKAQLVIGNHTEKNILVLGHSLSIDGVVMQLRAQGSSFDLTCSGETEETVLGMNAKDVDIVANGQTVEANLRGNRNTSLTMSGDDHISIGLKTQSDTPFVTIGSTATVVEQTGSEIKYNPSTITIFNSKGEVAWQKP